MPLRHAVRQSGGSPGACRSVPPGVQYRTAAPVTWLPYTGRVQSALATEPAINRGTLTSPAAQNTGGRSVEQNIQITQSHGLPLSEEASALGTTLSRGTR